MGSGLSPAICSEAMMPSAEALCASQGGKALKMGHHAWLCTESKSGYDLF